MKKMAITAVMLVLPCFAVAQQQSTSGMNMEQPNTMQMPGDRRNPGQQQKDQGARKETQSIENSEQQQTTQHGIKPGPGSDAESVTHMTMTLQEPENPDHHTGKSLPVPELLGDVAKRTPMTIEDFESMAMRSNPTLAQSRSYVRRSEQQGHQAGLYPNPTVGYTGDEIRGGSYGGGEQGAFVQQNIVLGGKLGLRRNIYRQQARENQIGVDEQTYRVRDAVQQAFYRALVSQAMVVLRQRLLGVTLDATETAHQLSNVGQADAPDVLQAEVEAEQSQVEFLRAQRDYLRDFHALAAVAGTENLAVRPLKGNIENPPEIDAKEQVEKIVSESPTVKRAEQEVNVAEARLRDAGREAVPDLNMRAGEYWSGEKVPAANYPTGALSFISAGVKVPLWNRNQGNIGAAKADLERARQDVARTRMSLKQQAEALAQQYLTARFEADRYRTEMLPRARRAYELYLMKYQQMAVAYPQVLVSQRTLFQLQIGYLRALSMVWRNGAALQNYTLTGGLDQPTGAGISSTTINLPNGGGSQ